jgi:hypothetical protein
MTDRHLSSVAPPRRLALATMTFGTEWGWGAGEATA